MRALGYRTVDALVDWLTTADAAPRSPNLVASLTGHPASLAEAERLVRDRLPGEATIAP